MIGHISSLRRLCFYAAALLGLAVGSTAFTIYPDATHHVEPPRLSYEMTVKAPAFTANEVCPEPIINAPVGQICKGTAVQFSAPDLGFPCLTYVWDFGSTATPQFATGKGPHNVTFNSAGIATVKLTIDNGCDNDLPAGGSSGSGSSGVPGSGSGSGSNGQTGGVICPTGGMGSTGSSGSSGSGGSGSGGTGSGSNGTSGSNGGGDPCGGNAGSSGTGGSGSGGSTGSGSGSGSASGGSGDAGSDCPCIECRKTKTIMVQVDNCAPGASGKIGDFVWRDNNANGIQDAGEPGIANVFVILERCNGAFVKFTTTNANGQYLFEGLQGGQYRVKFANPGGGLFATTQNAGADDCKDSDADQFGFTACFTLGDGATDLCVDAGFRGTAPPACSVSPVVSNIICNDNGTPTNSADDKFSFTLTVGGTGTSNGWNAVINGVNQSGSYNVPKNLGPYNIGGGALTFDVKDNANANCKASVTVNPPAPCSNQPPAPGSIGDLVWNDLNQNGAFNAGEPGVGGVTVKLFKCDNTLVATTTTNASGNYNFANVASNMQYFVEFSGLPPGLQFTAKDAAADNIDSDANPANGRTDCFFLSPGQNDVTRDAGIFQQQQQNNASVGDFVWNDLDKDGIQDAGEPGVQGVTVKLWRCDNAFIGQFTTNANGGYQFVNLAAGSYFLEFMNLPAGFVFSPKDAGADDSKDSDANTTTGKTDCFNLAAGQNDPTRDAGINQPQGTSAASVGDFVWFDTNGNGIQDAGEPGVAGIFVILETCAGAFVNFATTNAQGAYLINNVSPGSYRIKFASPGTINGSPVQFTVKDAGGDDTKDSDADPFGFTACFNLVAGQSNTTIDAGFTGQTPPPVCTINGTVSNVVCNNGQVCFTLVVNGSNTGEWGYDIPALNQYTLQYGQPYNFCMAGSANPQTLNINDHDVAGCVTSVSITSPPPCNTGGGGGGGTPNCDAITITGGSGKITIAGLTAPIEVVKVFNAAWQTVFECSANCADPTVVNNLPAGTYFVKVQLFNASWMLICTKEGYVTVSNFTGGGGGSVSLNEGKQTGEPGFGAPGNEAIAIEIPAESEAEMATEKTGEPLVGRTGEAETEAAALVEPTDLNLLPNPAGGHVLVHWGKATNWQRAELILLNPLGQVVRHVELQDAQEGSHRLDLDELKGGQYVVRFRADGTAPVVKKLIISR